jgi:hypothetical protein
MALYNAIQRMPETTAAEAGTMVVGAVPATRVAPAAAGGDTAATVAIPTPPVAAPVIHAAAPAPPRSKVPMMAGAAAVIVIGAVAARFAFSGKPAPVAADTSAKPTAEAAVPKKDSLTQFSKLQGGAEPSASPATPAPRSLAQLEEDAAADKKADGVLAALSSVKTTNDDERARVNFIRFKAYTTKLDDEKACIAIREAVRLAVDPTAKDKYQQRAVACQ